MEETGNIGKTLEKQLHAGLGGASFILMLAIGVLTAGIFLLTGHVSLVLEEQGKENEVLSAVMGLMLLGLIFSQILPLGLGVGGLLQKNRRKIFAIFGVALAAVQLLLGAALLLVGLLLTM